MPGCGGLSSPDGVILARIITSLGIAPATRKAHWYRALP
jgi:hypothetical protein